MCDIHVIKGNLNYILCMKPNQPYFVEQAPMINPRVPFLRAQQLVHRCKSQDTSDEDSDKVYTSDYEDKKQRMLANSGEYEENDEYIKLTVVPKVMFEFKFQTEYDIHVPLNYSLL